jgi:hypothetical protein
MGRFFIVSETFSYETPCFCETGEHKELFEFNKGDIIEFEEDYQVSVDHGLFYTVVINNLHKFYMSIEEIDGNFLSKRFVSIKDMEYMIKQLKNYVDYALDIGDKKLFLHYSEQLIDANKLVINFESQLTIA